MVRPGGVVCAAAISRFASMLDGLLTGAIDEPAFAEIVKADLDHGVHRNPTRRPEWFTTAYFHRPEELRAEILAAGLDVVALVGLEGPLWLLPDLSRRWADPRAREELLVLIRTVEAEPSFLGVSAHLLAVGRRPQ